ncbi:hypothetical protein ACJRO7_027732 [Eucalyptus globulus]|uniref:40S ribosomal protein S25 n=1 Tax=Eucalyptus globulus TaxID=34317 RepID=A0ABD3JWV2_EUCGL
MRLVSAIFGKRKKKKKRDEKRTCFIRSCCSYLLSMSGLKWSKGKRKEKVNNMVLSDQATYDKPLSEVNGSLARKAIRELMARGLIRMVSAHSSQQIYTRATNT